jgi:glycosyltransferase involved in cell wall biosynthesis
VDEIWAGSRYQEAAYVAAGAVPVRHMPMAVTVDATAGRSRADFGLPADRFLFVFSFDLLSGPARKNPEGCIEAFRRAFPRGDEPAGLVLKAMRADAAPEAWADLRSRAAADPRIRLLAGTLARGELLDLYRACDGYLSLHRSEGFGRGMAEAMLLGKPVICTGYSGNTDFATPETAALVRHGLRPVAGNEYPWGSGQNWAEPDLDDAAAWMRRIATDAALCGRLAEAGRRAVATSSAPVVVGRRYREALLASGARP